MDFSDYPMSLFYVKHSVLCPLHAENSGLVSLQDAHLYTSTPTNLDVCLPKIKTYFYLHSVYTHCIQYWNYIIG